MRKFLIAGALLVIGLWAAMDVASRVSWRAAARREWPAGLGTLESVPQRVPSTSRNAAADKLIALTTPLGVDLRPRVARTPRTELPARNAFEDVREPLSEYIARQIMRSDDAIDPPPAPLAAYLAAHGRSLDAALDHLLSGPIVWETRLAVDAPIPNLVGHMELGRLLTARALDAARAGDAAAWDDLHAEWRMSEVLFQRPELISVLIAVALARNVNAAARKLPLPEPAWFAETRAFDYERRMLAVQQAESWMMTLYVEDVLPKPLRVVLAPYLRFSLANSVTCMRENAVREAATTGCASAPASAPIASWNTIGKAVWPNATASWRRFLRFRAEREATANVLRIRRGQPPILASACVDRTWTFTRRADGTMAMKLDKDVPSTASEKIRVPLEY